MLSTHLVLLLGTLNFKKINHAKTSCAIITITDYKKDPIKDREMINIISNNYKTIYLWNQGSNDIEYLKTITTDNVFKEIKVIPSSLSYLDNFLKVYRYDLNYIGTRLHAGIYCMDKGIRTHIVGVDQRARNIASEVGLQFIERSKIEKLDNLISSDYNINCSLPNDKNIRVEEPVLLNFMKICFIIDYFTQGGADKVICRLSNKLSSLGHSISYNFFHKRPIGHSRNNQ